MVDDTRVRLSTVLTSTVGARYRALERSSALPELPVFEIPIGEERGK